MLHKSYYLLLTIVLLIMPLACKNKNPTTPDPTSNTIIIRDNFFDPQTITVAAGRIVVWRHMGSNQHTVTSGTPTSNPGAQFNSGVLSSGGAFTLTFNQPGTYVYFCQIHGALMTGSVVAR